MPHAVLIYAARCFCNHAPKWQARRQGTNDEPSHSDVFLNMEVREPTLAHTRKNSQERRCLRYFLSLTNSVLVVVCRGLSENSQNTYASEVHRIVMLTLLIHVRTN
eukprot:5167409-Amphidinium_carterae.2